MDVFSPNWLLLSALVSHFSMPVLPYYSPLTAYAPEYCIETRAAYDIGSQGTKFMLARVDVCQGVINEVLLQDRMVVAYRDDLYFSPDNKFSPAIRKVGTQALTHAKAKMQTLSSDISQHCAITTASFRDATNAKETVREIMGHVEIPIKMLSQHDEGKLAFYSVMSKMPSIDPASIVVWDIGAGSTQFTSRVAKDSWQVDGSELAATSFQHLVLEHILGKTLDSSLEPLSLRQIEQAMALARRELRIEQIPNTLKVIGVGAVHNKLIYPLCQAISPSNEGYYTRDALEQALVALAQQPLLDKDQLQAITNTILVYATMTQLGIEQVTPVAVSNVEGLILMGC